MLFHCACVREVGEGGRREGKRGWGGARNKSHQSSKMRLMRGLTKFKVPTLHISYSVRDWYIVLLCGRKKEGGEGGNVRTGV